MPRPIITTTYTERPGFTLNYLIQEALGKILTEDGRGIILENSVAPTNYNTRIIPNAVYN